MMNVNYSSDIFTELTVAILWNIEKKAERWIEMNEIRKGYFGYRETWEDQRSAYHWMKSTKIRSKYWSESKSKKSSFGHIQIGLQVVDGLVDQALDDNQ